MNYYQDMINSYEENFNLIEFLQLKSPKTPPQQSVVGMRVFDLDTLRNCVLHNFLQHGLYIQPSTTKRLIDFFKGEFTDKIMKTCLQVLVHFSKMDVNLQYEKYSNSFERVSPPNAEKLTLDEFFDNQLSSFLEMASMTCVEEACVWVFPEDRIEFIHNTLQMKPMILAFEAALQKLIGSESQSIPDLHKEIANMNVYGVKKFVPISGLRGACLLDGILVCTNNLAGYEGTITHQADLITLAAHECGHFLARIYFNDYNFSSPSKFLADGKHRFDPVIQDLSLEMGRLVELYLFDGVQPSWVTSSAEAATAFIDRLHTSTSIPVISANEHKKLGIMPRLNPSPPFGIDLLDQDFFC